MLKAHMDIIEDSLIAKSRIQENTGHSLHKGTPREVFIKEFLESHLPGNVSIGTGEIIDCNSRPGEQRNQYDIIIYKKEFPKLDFGGGIFGYLIESVVATIEVKSTLTKEEFKKAAKAAYNSKRLNPNYIQSFSAGYIPPKILNYIIAYDGPAKMETVHSWISEVYKELQIPYVHLPLDEKSRESTPASAIDAIFVLNKGLVSFDNTPFGFIYQHHRIENPESMWAICNFEHGSLLYFFMLLQDATANIQGRWLNTNPYLRDFRVQSLGFGN